MGGQGTMTLRYPIIGNGRSYKFSFRSPKKNMRFKYREGIIFERGEEMARQISEEDAPRGEEERIPELPEDLVKYVEKPYGGLFGDSSQVKIVEEIVADPYTKYRPKDIEELVGASAPTVRRVLNTLTSLGLLLKDKIDPQHPVYCANLQSKKLLALTFLAYAMADDIDGSECLNDAIRDYYHRVLKPEIYSEIIDFHYSHLSSYSNWQPSEELLENNL